MCRGEKPVWVPNMGSDFNVLQPEVMPDATARSYGGTDWFGIKWKYEPLSAAAMVEPGTRRLSDITKWKEELVWPDLSSIDWEADYKKNYEAVMDPDRPTLFVIVNGFFERTADLTSFEDTFYYLLEEQEALNEFYTKLCDFHIDLIRIAKKYYHADCILSLIHICHLIHDSLHLRTLHITQAFYFHDLQLARGDSACLVKTEYVHPCQSLYSFHFLDKSPLSGQTPHTQNKRDARQKYKSFRDHSDHACHSGDK